MKTKKISASDWQGAEGISRLFRKINDSVINRYMSTSPIEVLNLIFEPHGIVCDGAVTLYSCQQSGNEYFLRMHHHGDQTVYNVDRPAMPKGEGGFLKHASTLTEPELFPDISGDLTEEDERIVPWISGMRTALVVPTISVTGEAATSVLMASEVDAFSGEVLRTNITLTYAMTNIILSWILRIQSEKMREALDKELASVGRIQREFLPKSLPDTERLKWAVHYSTSTRAGGDYYDFLPLSGGRTGVIIADVSGHGSQAAIVMAMTRLLLHTYPGVASPADEVLGNLNSRLVGNLLLGQFVTAFYCIIDPEEMTLKYSNAGHCHPLILRAGEDQVESLGLGGGLPLGVAGDGRFSEECVELNSGDVLVLYTDGLREAMDKKREIYGEERLVEVIKGVEGCSADEIKDEILKDVFEFLGGEEIEDDMTILVLKMIE